MTRPSGTPMLVPVGLLALAGVAAFVLVFPARAETKTYSFSNFDSVSVSAGVDVVLKQGPYAVAVEQHDGKFDSIEIEQHGSNLHISRRSNVHIGFFGWGSSRHYVVTVTAPTYTAIEASSGADVYGDNLSLKDLRVAASSGGDLKLSGACGALSGSASSGGDIKASDLKCQSATVSASSGGDADVYASTSVKGNASSGGDIRVHGKPGNVEKETSSGGDVRVASF